MNAVPKPLKPIDSIELLHVGKACHVAGIGEHSLVRYIIDATFPPPTIQNSVAYFWRDEVERWRGRHPSLVDRYKRREAAPAAVVT